MNVWVDGDQRISNILQLIRSITSFRTG